jgi:hypothetical protein
VAGCAAEALPDPAAVGRAADEPMVAGSEPPDCAVQAVINAPRPTEPPRASARRRLIRSLLAVTSSFIGA